ncbi:hypothetical protein AB833_28720 [Chromatiales bacterium (ex Bugula neritina AB1)]|nr:hypothetical protein AB833_28720 [Chromatiales bacterium (ex Bugula neritina AB1)]
MISDCKSLNFSSAAVAARDSNDKVSRLTADVRPQKQSDLAGLYARYHCTPDFGSTIPTQGNKLDSKDLAFLTSLGFSKLAAGMFGESGSIFEIISRQLPDDAIGPIGLASIEICNGHYNRAITILQDGPIHAKVNAHEARKVLLNALIFSNRMIEAGELHRSFIHIDSANDSEGYINQAGNFFHPDNINRAA